MTNRNYRYTKRNNSKSDELLIRLLICLALVAMTAGIKAWFPKGAEAVSDALLGDGGYAEAFMNFGESVSDGDGIKTAFTEMIDQLISVGKKVE